MNTLGALTFLAREAVAAVGHMIAGRAFHAYSDDGNPLADAEADRDVWEPAELARVVPLLEDIRNTLARMSTPGGGAWGDLLDPAAPTRSAWDIETSEGLAYAAEREARISAIVLITERHAITGHHRFLGDGYVCYCGRSFTGLDVWAEHVADLIDDAITTMIFPAAVKTPVAAGTGGLPPTTPPGRREAGRPTNPTK